MAITRGTSYENKDNLAPAFFAEIVRRYQGTRLGRQELDADILDDVPGALWAREWIDQTRAKAPPDLSRVVVAIDPAVTSGEDADETGIVVAGVSNDQHVYILADHSGRYTPHEWAQKAIAAYHQFSADCVVAEVNNGGEMVAAVLRQVDPNVTFRAVHSYRGKVTRAEPCAALYEQGRAHHVGLFPRLEDQLCAFTSDFDRKRAGYSPDRADALVWALTTLVVERVSGLGLLQWYEQEAARLGLTGLLPGDTIPDQQEQTVKMRAPADWTGTFYGIDGSRYAANAGELVNINPKDAVILRILGFAGQPVDATHVSNPSAGVLNSKVLRGRSFS